MHRSKRLCRGGLCRLHDQDDVTTGPVSPAIDPGLMWIPEGVARQEGSAGLFL